MLHKIFTTFCLLLASLFLFQPSSMIAQSFPTPPPVVRGNAKDLWADIVLGKRDIGELSPREIVPYKVSAPGGVIVDRSVSPGRMYVWDSGNSRILGIDLGACYASGGPCTAQIVIGQPSGNDYGACNQDASYSGFPVRKPASANTLCGISENTHTTLEDKTFTRMFVDQSGNLFVADVFNHRVLKFLSPFTTDVIADEVWGQADFAGNGCNRTGGLGFGMSTVPSPTANSLCFGTIGGGGAGVRLDESGNMWVADGGNNRVLRFPKQSDASIAKTADLVLGQPDFTAGGDWSFSSALNRFHSPTDVFMDTSGKVYVADGENNRILVFSPPFTNGMTASIFPGVYNALEAFLPDPEGRGIFIFDHGAGGVRIRLITLAGNTLFELPGIGHQTGGSIGIDTQGNILVATAGYGQDVFRYSLHPDGSYLADRRLFSPPEGYNLTSSRRFEHGAYTGVAISGNQLVVADGRLLFWNNYKNLTNGQTPDGILGGNVQVSDPSFWFVKADIQNRIWVSRYNRLEIYQGPLTVNSLPIQTISGEIPDLSGNKVKMLEFSGIAPEANGRFIWVSDAGNHRVVRIKNPLTTPVVDVILGQTNTANNIRSDDGFAPAHDNPDFPNMCNRGLVPPPNTGTPEVADIDMLCFPGAVALDQKGNLYVSDHTIESAGNWRMLMFMRDQFPLTTQTMIYASDATKEFPLRSATNPYTHATFGPAFDSTNRMVVGENPYLSNRFVKVYDDPTKVNPENPRDPLFAIPDAELYDLYNWPISSAFDAEDNLYVFDANRGQVRIYKDPFNSPPKFDREDVNQDGVVDALDLFVILSEWFSNQYSRADINHDGKINAFDAVAVIKKL